MSREESDIEHFKKEEIWTKKWLHFLQQLEMESATVQKVQEKFAGCELTDEEIRQECEAVRQQMYKHN